MFRYKKGAVPNILRFTHKIMPKWMTITPILSEYENRHLFEIPFGDVKIVPTPDWLRNEAIVKDLGLSRKMRLEDSEVMFLLEYEADSYGDPVKNWKSETAKSKQDIAFERIQLCNLALWLAKPTHLATDLLLHIQDDGEGYRLVRHSSSHQSINPHIRDRKNSHDKESYDKARKLNIKIWDLERKHSPWMATRSLFDALTTHTWEVRFILLWVALEALFGTNSEITYRLSNRISFFLSNNKTEAKKLFLDMKTSYGLRSEIIHGLKISKAKGKKRDIEKVVYDTETTIRSALSKILLDKKLTDIFSIEKKREEFLDELAYV